MPSTILFRINLNSEFEDDSKLRNLGLILASDNPKLISFSHLWNL